MTSSLILRIHTAQCPACSFNFVWCQEFSGRNVHQSLRRYTPVCGVLGAVARGTSVRVTSQRRQHQPPLSTSEETDREIWSPLPTPLLSATAATYEFRLFVNHVFVSLEFAQ